MKRLLFSLSAVFALTILLQSCDKEDSNDVNQTKIYTVYELFYNKNEDKTTAICRLRFGGPTGTLLEATSPASVKYNGDDLPYSVIYSGHAKEYAGKLVGGTFVYTNVDGVVYTNSVPSMDSLAFNPTFDTIVKSQANTFTWIGNSTTSTERVNLYVGTWTWGQDAAFFAFGQGQTNIIMGVSQMNGLALGNSTMYLERINEVAVTQGTTEGGVIRTRYRPLNQQAVIVP